MTSLNYSQAEIDHFSALAGRWWDPDGDLRTLHDINPTRLRLVDDLAALAGKTVVDVGCGGGLLSEAMGARAANVTGIDLSAEALAVARLHLAETGAADVDYRAVSARDLASERPHSYDVVTCMEMLEHVPDPAELVRDCAMLAAAGGHVIFSTISRSPKAFALAIFAGEYLTNLVPRGTHSYEQFIRPSELATWGRRAGLTLAGVHAGHYEPVTRRFTLGGSPDVNYFAHFRAPARWP
jgi:2-polyprenyl-6-hydroxyphenyl methylase/3-demethylubiquinone-9 3-methyltransferase